MDGSALTFVSQGSVREGEREGGKERENPQLTPLLQIERGKKCFFFSACGKRRVAGGDEIARVFSFSGIEAKVRKINIEGSLFLSALLNRGPLLSRKFCSFL